MPKFNLCIEKRNGLVYKAPISSEKEEDAVSSVQRLLESMLKGERFYLLSSRPNNPHTVIRVDEIVCVYYTPIDHEQERRNEEDRELRMRLLRAQVEYHEGLSAGDSWKKNYE